MKANETHLQKIISQAEQQFMVPLFQRPYSWGLEEWDDLWTDLLELYEGQSHKDHFLGAIVTIPLNPIPQGISKYLLIDGQQRLSTIFILLSLIRDKTDNHQLAQQIQVQQLINQFQEAGSYDYYKLQPTQQDRKAFCDLIDRLVISPDSEKQQIIQCYRFFEKKFEQVTSPALDLKKLYEIIVKQLSIVSIVLEHDENPHLVFESLNARGRPLTQADLVRNYFFMRITSEDQERVFDTYWLPMQTFLNEGLTEYIRHYLIASTGAFTKQTEVFITLKKQVSDENVLDKLQDMAIYAEYYRKILDPSLESSRSLRPLLARINRIGVTVAYPFLLKCYHAYANNILSEKGFIEILHLVESLVIRRTVCGRISADLNKLFPALCQTLSSGDFKNETIRVLRKYYPSDSEFKDALVNSNAYRRSEKGSRTKLILESLEASYSHKEAINTENTTIEHVMPQKIEGTWWETHLGTNWKDHHETYLHTLGNLTLTAYNSELSNKEFSEKKKIFKDSHLELNRYFISLSEWKTQDILKRSEDLSVQCLKIWPDLEHILSVAHLPL